ncbi:hypothetical protein BO99DRAFT_419536 [Aspergillus violaceofuscus CBS 115571]|uniref:Uncharacterized protein n=1 Tax=Aspergillus violaceofuscus (strain CBS 115571) TaxID=1450538 RepID=A0A2V5HFJ6_ASPV1|nr:hypothetical protein BO99DRAFT_419536 [Aspergillus violaceofuscus CBS 115571]
MPEWQTQHTTAPLPTPSDLSSSFSLRAPPATDLWASPPGTCIFTAPFIYQAMPLASFRRARVTIAAGLAEKPYAQAGLALLLPQSDGQRRWVKTGLEVLEGRRVLATVGRDRWPDCSLVPADHELGRVTMELIRQENNLIVSRVKRTENGEGEREVLRELGWVFAPSIGDLIQEECWVGVFVANPSGEADAFDVWFEGLAVEGMEDGL